MRTALVDSQNLWWDIRLSSMWVVVVLAVSMVAATVMAVMTWDVDRFKRLRRSTLLVLAQVLGLLTLAAGINVAGAFYGSLADLVGAKQAAAPLLQTDKLAQGHASVEPWLAEARKISGPGKGVWTSTRIAGKRTGYDLPAWVYVPDAYFDPGQSTRKFPVSLLLSGYPGAIENWQHQGGVVPMLDQLMASGKIQPMIMVSVSQNPDPNHDSECVDAVNGVRADTYISQDVPEALAQHFRVLDDRKAWSLMGYSTGGYCAVNLALRHSSQFSAAISLDGYFAPVIDATTGDLFKHNIALQQDYTPAHTIHNKRRQPLRFYVVVGNAEPEVKVAGRKFAASVHLPDTVTLLNTPGGHNWGTWSSAIPSAMEWLSSELPDKN